MAHTVFYHYFPEIADKETRVISILDKSDTGLPKGEYAFIELYCTDTDCDCRTVFVNVFNLQSREEVATISYGWEQIEYYKDWMGADEDDYMLKNYKGPDLVPLARQAQFACRWLDMFKKIVDSDKDYANRLERHYHLVKSVIGDDKVRSKV